MPVSIDFVYVVFLVGVASLFEYYYFWPRLRARTAAGDQGARRWAYQRGIAGQWGFVAVLALMWIHYGRPLADLRLTAPAGWRLIASVVLVALMLAFVAYQLKSVLRLSAERRAAARPKLARVDFILPHTRRDHRWFLALSLTAGICEELLYRGYLVWFLTPWLGLAGAYVGVIVLFGVGHLYQGRNGATRATAAGAAMTGFVALTGWLIPAMIIHALIDAGSGTVGYLILRDEHLPAQESQLRAAEPLAG